MVVLWFALATAGFSMLLGDDPWADAVAQADKDLGETGPLAEIRRAFDTAPTSTDDAPTAQAP